VAVLPPISWLSVDNEILEAQERVVSYLRRMGLRVDEVAPEGFGDLRHYYSLYLSILTATTSAGLPRAIRFLHALASRSYGSELLAARASGLLASASDYITWYAQRERFRAAYRVFFREWDILLTPANIVNAFPHTNLPFHKRRLDVNGQQVAYLLQNVYPGLATLCGQPATVFPVGFTRAGLPTGLQVIGPYLEDRTTLHFVTLFAREFGGFCPPPAYV